ncbi:MAG: hypothetical protein JW963_09245 [Anaerolineales bacterium]|nr:hypothetical protein [Anaerolineales bacterium]
MQTLRLIIPGSYYDSQIYSGHLYLWSHNGSIITINWDDLIENINIPDRLITALTCAFQVSEYLYGEHWKLIFQDKEIKTAIQGKFEELAKEPIEVSKEDLQRFTVREQDNPLTFPHADSTIYRNILYIGSQSGILAANVSRKNKIPISTKPEKLWDGPALNVTASYLTLAISSGSAGLFEYSLDTNYNWYKRQEPRLLLKHHSNFVRWLYASVFSSSYFDEGYLADFVLEQERIDEERIQQRVLRDVVPSSRIFEHQTKNGMQSLTWGLHDKICFATSNSVEVVQYAPYKRDENKRFLKLGMIQTEDLHGDIISGDSALFGFVIEGENGLLIINSLMESMWLKGEPVNWRVFPRSKFYTNQLHVIYEDNLCIHSFNQDYFVNQETKMVGIRHPKEFPSRRTRI